MKIFRYFIGVFVLAVLAFSVVQFKKTSSYSSLKYNLSEITNLIKYKLGIIGHNISTDVDPQRKIPLTLIVKQEKLKALSPDYVLGDFTPEEWHNFWELIYGYKEEGEGWPKAKVYRSKGEIEEELIYNYPDPFSYFKDRQWNYFWSVVLGK